MPGVSTEDLDEPRGFWGVNPDGAVRLQLMDGDESPRCAWDLRSDGAVGVTLSGADGEARGALHVNPNGAAVLDFFDNDQARRAALGTVYLAKKGAGVAERPAESVLMLFDKDGKTIFRAP